ncbi:protein of unknown function [Candidatus Promineifilum breve]|uniref:MalT-like TPR region domain-containing protein n=1 Tax=Candidatus Promineifilum breve TaxID=1806508 RepID=A0A160T554_9CHLR|nr:protein of unknown function [Candidatus Promineifilum breve]
MTPLRTKLNRPRLRQNHTPRRTLVDRLNSGLRGDMTLVNAPAGYGKTSLAVEWAEQSPLPVAWLALDKSDDEVNIFLAYLIAAIRSLFPEACPTTLALTQGEPSASRPRWRGPLSARERPCPQRWSRWSGPGCFSTPSTTAASGSPITPCFATRCVSCWPKPTPRRRSPSCTCGPASGLTNTISWKMR